jgi:hypothetical protein
MIYERVSADEPIRQGDILIDVPRVDISLSEINVLARDASDDSIDPRRMSWAEAIKDDEVSQTREEHGQHTSLVRAVLPVSSVMGVVVTQDCDALRAEDLSLCEIAPLPAIDKGALDQKTPKNWAKFLCRDQVRWLYLPVDDGFGIRHRMAVDFRSILRLPRQELSVQEMRIARLNTEARDYFREKVSQFFRRYAFNRWFPLTKEECEAYEAEFKETVQRYPWQG